MGTRTRAHSSPLSLQVTVLEVKADVDDAEIFSTALIWCTNEEDISNLSPVSTSLAPSSFQLLCFNRWRAGLVALVY